MKSSELLSSAKIISKLTQLLRPSYATTEGKYGKYCAISNDFFIRSEDKHRGTSVSIFEEECRPVRVGAWQQQQFSGHSCELAAALMENIRCFCIMSSTEKHRDSVWLGSSAQLQAHVCLYRLPCRKKCSHCSKHQKVFFLEAPL